MISLELDLFQLHDPREDICPRSWIKVKGKFLFGIVNTILKELNDEGITKYSIIKRISKELNCHKNTVDKSFYGIVHYFHLPVLIELVNLWKYYLDKSEKNYEKITDMLKQNIESLSGRGIHYRYVNSVKTFDETFCKIIGAHIADGHLQKRKTKNGCSFRIIIIDHYKSNLKAYKKWIKKVFGINCLIEKADSDAWRIIINDKVIGRYFHKILNLPTGYKTADATTPNIIKQSQDSFQMAFLKGFMTFDGCVETCGVVSTGTLSKVLMNELSIMFQKFNLNMVLSEKDGFYHATSNRLYGEEIKKWMNFFEKGTEKFYKLNDMLNGFTRSVKNIQEALIIFKKTYGLTNSSKITINDVINTLKEMKICDKYILTEKLNVGISTIYRYIHLLENANILRRTTKPQVETLDFFHPTFTRILIEPRIRNIMFEKLFNKLDKGSIIKELNISLGTLKNWHRGITKISLDKLRKILSIINWDYRDISESIMEFNRKAFYFNQNFEEWKVPERPWISV